MGMHVGRSLLVAAGIALLAASPVRAQLPGFSLKAGAAIPLQNESDVFGTGLHLGAALKLPILPLQIEGAFDRMGEDGAEDDLTIWSAGAAIPLSIAPFSPVAPYFIFGGGLYKADAGESSTDAGINAGAGLRLGLPGLKPFVEGRGVMIFVEDNKITYLNLALGIRF